VIRHQTHFSLPPLKVYLQLLAATVLLGAVVQVPKPAFAGTQIQCLASDTPGATLQNQATYSYADSPQSNSTIQITGTTNQISNGTTRSGVLTVLSQGIKNRNGELVFGYGAIADAINRDLTGVGFSPEEANKGSTAAVSAFAALSADSTIEQVMTGVKTAIAQAVPAKASLIDGADTALDQQLAISLTGLAAPTLESLGLTHTEATTASSAAATVVASPDGNSFNQMTQSALRAAVTAVPTQREQLRQARQELDREGSQIRSGAGSSIQAGDVLRFEYLLSNTGTAPIQVQIPTVRALQQSGMVGEGTVTEVSYATVGDPSLVSDHSNAARPTVTLSSGGQLRLTVAVRVGAIPAEVAALTLSIGSGCGNSAAQQTLALLPPTIVPPLIDPFGRVTGCAGETLPEYRGFSVGLYEPSSNSSTGEVGDPVRLTATELLDTPNNSIPAGLEPNIQNSNPFFLTNGDEGKYNFLLDVATGQLDRGQTYILLINPPEDSNYDQRRIRLVIGDRSGSTVSYTATSLDGRPISASNSRTSVTGTLQIDDAGQIGLNLATLDLDSSVCQAQSIQITKTGDRAAAEPGDTVIYRLTIRNLSNTPIDNLVISDDLPLGFNFRSDSVRGELAGESVNIDTEQEGSQLSFSLSEPLAEGEVLNIAYAAQLTPDALRGDGENTAIAQGERSDNRWDVRDGPAIHRLRVQSGIVSDCGTLIGRVFVDRNFDGEQQEGEPGVPNAVIYMDDGNRITTDANGLFSVANVLPGYRTGALDLSSLPGYTLAPNTRFIERNSQSRLVHLEPGGLVRMNFAVTPTFQEGTEP
jgi:uncharacterized repeat protein (TIGR01451 family)